MCNKHEVYFNKMSEMLECLMSTEPILSMVVISNSERPSSLFSFQKQLSQDSTVSVKKLKRLPLASSRSATCSILP